MAKKKLKLAATEGKREVKDGEIVTIGTIMFRTQNGQPQVIAGVNEDVIVGLVKQHGAGAIIAVLQGTMSLCGVANDAVRKAQRGTKDAQN